VNLRGDLRGLRLVLMMAAPTLGLAACNSSPPGIPITSMGSVSGRAVMADVGAWGVGDLPDADVDAGPTQLLTVALTSANDAGCPAPGTFAGSSIVTLTVPIPSAGFQPGLYPVGESAAVATAAAAAAAAADAAAAAAAADAGPDATAAAAAAAAASTIIAIGPPATATVAFVDTSCTVSAPQPATLGVIALCALATSQVAGSFDLLFGVDHLTGTFSMPICAFDGGTSVDDAGDAGSVCTP
jgi:hypothetical protein